MGIRLPTVVALLLQFIFQALASLPSDKFLIDSVVECSSDYAFEGRFRFLDNQAEAYWHLESDNVYFEYYAPSSHWTGIGASNQFIQNEFNHCTDCFRKNSAVQCLAQCVGDNQFVITSQGDTDPRVPWHLLELQTNNIGKNEFNQYQVATKLQSVWGIEGREDASFNLEKVDISGTEYIHGSWRRELKRDDSNQWVEPINDYDDVCWTTIASKANNPNARASELGYFVDKETVEIHCGIGQRRVCNADAAGKEDNIPHFGLQIADDVCEDKNLSLIVLMDSSLSVDSYFDISKSWISDLLQNTAEVYRGQREKSNASPVCFRSALVMFDHHSKLIWDIDEFHGEYDHELARSMMTEAIRESQLSRLSGTHIKDVLEYTIDAVFPKLHPGDTNVVLMLSDGEPSSCYAGIDQHPCHLSPNPISKAFHDYNARFLLVTVGDEQDRQDATSKVESTFECLFEDVQTLQKSVIGKSSYFDVNTITRSVQNAVQSHTCGLADYQCDLPLYPPGAQFTHYNKDWDYASYTFTVGNDEDIWPYSASIKVVSECDKEVALEAKLMRYDHDSKQTTLIKNADQGLKLSKNKKPVGDEFKFSFRGSSIDSNSGKTMYEKLERGGTYVVEFHMVDSDGKCKDKNKMQIATSLNFEYYDQDRYFSNIASSISHVAGGGKRDYSSHSQVGHPLVSLCVAERKHENEDNASNDNGGNPNNPSPSHAGDDDHADNGHGHESDIEPKESQEHDDHHDVDREQEPTKRPTLWPTRDYQNGENMHHCRAPKYFPSPVEWQKCNEHSVEWSVDFKNWFHNEHIDKTFIEYEICVMGVVPYGASPFMGKQPGAMSMVLFQIPCFCEVCLNEMTESMVPDHGYTTELHQGWIWEYMLYPGECSKFEITLDGYVPMEPGYYKVMGDNRWIEGKIEVPNPCQPSIGYPMDYYLDHKEEENLDKDGFITNEHHEHGKDSGSGNSTHSDVVCHHESRMYPDHDCSVVCDGYQDNEWRVDYVSSHNENGHTVFVYHAFVEGKVDDLECTKKEHDTSQELKKVYLRLGCDCPYQSKSFLDSITVRMEPFGEVHEDHWVWNLDLKEGEVRELKLVLKGENMEMGNSKMTLVGGDRRCTSSDTIKVPNPCKNDCNFGEWTRWSEFGQCSAECGGGYRYKTRECVSICDGVTRVDNCVGDYDHESPCNTNPCPEQHAIIAKHS